MRDLYFNAGSRLRISVGGPFVIWIRWGWKAEWQFGITKVPRLLLRSPKGWLCA